MSKGYFWKEVQPASHERLEKKIEEANDALFKARRNIKICCLHCGRHTTVKKLTVNTKMYWDHNVGDPNGGFYRQSADYFIECPKCDVESRYFEHMQQGYNREWKKVHTYRPWFKSRVDRFPKEESRCG